MTGRQLADKIAGIPYSQAVLIAVSFGIAWGVLRMQVSEKADRVEVRAVADTLAKKTQIGDSAMLQLISAQTVQLTTIGQDVKTIKSLLCTQAPKDSFCRPRM